MVQIISGTSAVLVALSVTIYMSVMGVLFWRLVLEEPGLRRALTLPLLPTFFQNCGIPVAILAFAFRSTDVALVAVLLIALGLAASSDETVDLNPALELPLLISAIASFFSVGLLNLLA